MRSNPIGHMIFITSKKCGMTNHKHDMIFFTSEKYWIFPTFELAVWLLTINSNKALPTDFGEFFKWQEENSSYKEELPTGNVETGPNIKNQSGEMRQRQRQRQNRQRQNRTKQNAIKINVYAHGLPRPRSNIDLSLNRLFSNGRTIKIYLERYFLENSCVIRPVVRPRG